jgi:hypothetical protein
MKNCATKNAWRECVVLNKYYEDSVQIFGALSEFDWSAIKQLFLYERYNVWMLLTDIKSKVVYSF